MMRNLRSKATIQSGINSSAMVSKKSSPEPTLLVAASADKKVCMTEPSIELRAETDQERAARIRMLNNPLIR